jgi:hypothetical protein
MDDPYEDWPPAKRDSGKDWSAAKLTILRLLWPGEWVEGSRIFEEVRQTYYDRRIRELREAGWNIETGTTSSGSRYRLLSHAKAKGQQRTYPSVREKRAVYRRDDKTCQICGQVGEHLQYDHKVPRERGGSTEIDNLQLLCPVCNVEKRGVCKKCQRDTCEGCPYAYPELFDTRLVVFLHGETAEKLTQESMKREISEASVAREIIRLYYSQGQS